jgi:ribosome-associated heat shock protein Hsp15
VRIDGPLKSNLTRIAHLLLWPRCYRRRLLHRLRRRKSASQRPKSPQEWSTQLKPRLNQTRILRQTSKTQAQSRINRLRKPLNLPQMSEANSGDTRLDIWLWRARFFKTRGMASDYVSRKGVRLTRHGETRKVTKAGARILPGDILTFYKAKTIETVEILAPGERRGPATEAQALYRRAPEDE